MKKIFSVFGIILFCFLSINCVCVDAEEINNRYEKAKSATDYKISYDITKFNISNNSNNEDVISIEGWSALSHMDNYGGSRGNMKTYIIAYISNGDKYWNDSGVKYKKYLTSFTGDGAYDLYPLRCEWSSNNDACSSEAWNNVNNSLKNNKKILYGNKCSEDGTVNGVYYLGSHCAYYNLGFKVSIKVNDIIKDLDIKETADVKFAIQTQVWYGKTLAKIDLTDRNLSGKPKAYRQDSANIGLVLDENQNNGDCSIYGNSCVEGKEYRQSVKYSDVDEKFDRKIIVSGLSDIVKFTAENAYEFADNGTTYRNYIKDGFGNVIKFSPNANYQILQIGPRQDYSMRAGLVKNVRRFRLKDISSGAIAWGYSFWTKSTGNFSLKLDPIPQYVPPCLDNCVGSNCQYDDKGCPIAPRDLEKVSCEAIEKSGCQSVSFGEEDGTCGKSVSNSDYYYRISATELAKKITGYTFAASNTKVIRNGDYYYVPIKLIANVTYSQTAALKLSNQFSDGQIVTSGRSFNFDYQYTVSSSWNYRGVYDINTSANNTFGFVEFKLKKVGSNKVKDFKIFAFLGIGDEVYIKNGSSFEKYGDYNLELYKQIISQKAKNSAKNLENSQNTVVFDDSNDKSKKLNVSTAGNFSCDDYSLPVDQWEAGSVRKVDCKYKLKKAFFSNSGDGNVRYDDASSVSYYQLDSNNTDGSKSLYYIPVDLKTGDAFKFNIQSNSLSLVSGFTFSHLATCKVIANNEFRSDKLVYRSIDTSNPFPKVVNNDGYPQNWKQYIESNGLSRITDHSFEVINYQTEFMKSKQKFSTFKNDYGDYSSYDDIKKDGSGSSKIIKNDLFTIINRSHCRVGEWDSSCDKLQ